MDYFLSGNFVGVAEAGMLYFFYFI